MRLKQPIRLMRSFLTVGGWTLVSAARGFVRDVMMAAYLGAGPVAEAFLIAFSLPNMFRRFFAEGRVQHGLRADVRQEAGGGRGRRGLCARCLQRGMAGLLIVFTLLGTLAMPWLVWAMASRLCGRRAVRHGGDLRPDRLSLHPVHLAGGALVGRAERLWPVHRGRGVPVLMNLMFIAAMLAPHGLGHGADAGLDGAGHGRRAAGLHLGAAARARASVHPLGWPRLTPELKRLAIIAGPAVLAGGVVQINLLVGRQVASFTEGAVAWLSYADRLYQLPLGVVGIAIGTVLLPDLSRRLRAGDTEGGRQLQPGHRVSLALTVPAAVALVVIALPLCLGAVPARRLRADDTANTRWRWRPMASACPPSCCTRCCKPLYFAREDTRSPFNYAVVAMVVNAPSPSA
jgi:putative peptidoglycan lipid II flippase